MRILMLSHMYPSPVNPTAGIFVHEQVQALQRRGHDVRVVSPKGWAPPFLPRWESYRRVPGTDEVHPAQLVLLAMGFVGPERGPLLEQLGVELDDRGLIARDRDWATNVDGVYVCGDMGRGQSLIVWAIAEGRSAARAIDLELMGESDLPAPV